MAVHIGKLVVQAVKLILNGAEGKIYQLMKISFNDVCVFVG